MIASASNCVSFPLENQDATAQLARRFAALALPGLTVLLDGPVGAGKTFFARVLIQHLQAAYGQVEDIPSPTFTLVQTYHAGALEIWHADLYRMTSTDELLELGLDEAFDTSLCLIEWPDRMGDLAPPNALTLRLEPTATKGERTCQISCADSSTLAKITQALGHA